MPLSYSGFHSRVSAERLSKLYTMRGHRKLHKGGVLIYEAVGLMATTLANPNTCNHEELYAA
jgi:hypothetical protein